MRHVITCLFILVCGLPAPVWADSMLVGRWAGTLSYREAPLEVAITFAGDPEQLSAQLDIPSLVYAGQDIQVTAIGPGQVSVDLPFGIGRLALALNSIDELSGNDRGFSLTLERRPAPVVTRATLKFGAFKPALEGTLHLPAGPGPHAVVVLIAGSGNASRQNWSYASWTEFYLRHGIGAFIYDRRDDLAELPDGRVAGIDDHARDVADAVRRLRQLSTVDPLRIGLSGGSRGAWIAMAANQHVKNLAFFNFHSVAPVTPAEQETTSILTGMRDDQRPAADLDAARAYLRLYFYVAQTGKGWNLLEDEISRHRESEWLQYVDQPRSLEDLRWWKANINFDTGGHLAAITTPILASWGGNDFITPWAEYRAPFKKVLNESGNQSVTTKVYPGADHRLEIGFGEQANGQWQWFGMAPGLLDDLAGWLQVQLRTNSQVQ